MQWSDDKYAGFSDVEPWMVLNENWRTNNVKKHKEDPNSILLFYKNLLALKKKEKALSQGRQERLRGHEKALCYLREFDEKRFLVCINCTGRKIKVKTGLDGEAKIALSTERTEAESDVMENISEIPLKGYQGLILELK